MNIKTNYWTLLSKSYTYCLNSNQIKKTLCNSKTKSLRIKIFTYVNYVYSFSKMSQLSNKMCSRRDITYN